MREIKFRVLDNETEKMYFPGKDETQLVFGDPDTFDQGDSLWEEYGEICSGRKMTLMQFTGLHDKDGTPIYEGDILLITAPHRDPIISEVKWGGIEYPAFDLPKYDGYGMNAFSSIFHSNDDEKMKVIGNIHENPELLNG